MTEENQENTEVQAANTEAPEQNTGVAEGNELAPTTTSAPDAITPSQTDTAGVVGASTIEPVHTIVDPGHSHGIEPVAAPVTKLSLAEKLEAAALEFLAEIEKEGVIVVHGIEKEAQQLRSFVGYGLQQLKAKL